MFLLKNSFLFFANLIFCCFTLKNTPSCPFKYFEISDLTAIKKKRLNVYFLYSYVLTFTEKDKMVAERLYV